MAEQLPNWQERFLEEHQLPSRYLDSAQKWFAPVAGLLAEHQNGAGRPLLVGVNGSQGSGKTTLCDYFCAVLKAQYGLSCVALSLDDFYLTGEQRRQLGGSVHPLLATRGVPGTHDLDLLHRTLDRLLAGEAAPVPRFDKSIDDRRTDSDWDRVSPGVDLVLLEGWCLGVAAQSDEALDQPLNELESTADSDGKWRQYANEALRSSYPQLYARVDEWIMLRAPSFDCVYRWRLEQEQKLASHSSGSGIMSQAQIARFIQFYQRLTMHCLETLPHKVNHLFTLDEQRSVKSYMAAPGSHP